MKGSRLLLSALALACTCAFAKVTRVPLDVQVNGLARPGIVAWMEDGELWLAKEDAKSLGLKNLPEGKVLSGKASVPLKALGQGVTFDEGELKLVVVLDATELNHNTVVDLAAIRNRTAPVSNANGFILDYEVGAGRAGNSQMLDLVTRMHSSIAGVQFLDERTTTVVDGVARSIALRTTVRKDWPSEGLRMDLGTLDIPDGGLATWGGLRGIGFGSMSEGTAAQNALRGATSLSTAVRFPSVADIYVNGVRQGTYNVAPGTFDLQGLRGFSSGATDVKAVVRDMYGNETVLEKNSYVGESTIRAGAQQFAYQVGQDPFAPERGLQARATHRWGATSGLTLVAKAEARKDFAQAQAGFALSLGRVGEVSAAVMDGHASGEERPRGFYVNHAYEQRNWSTVTTLLSRPEYAFSGVGKQERMTQFSTRQTWSPSDGDQFGIRLAHTGYADGSNAREVELTWSHKLAAGLTLQSAVRHSSLTGAAGQLMLTWLPSAKYTATAFTLADRNGVSQQTSLSKTPALGEATWRLDSRLQENGTHSATFNVDKDLGPGTLKMSTTLSQAPGSGSVAGGRVAWHGGVIAGYGGVALRSNQANAAVVVDAQGLPGISVFRNGTKVGVTDEHGYFWLTNLPGYEEVRVSLDENAIPMNRWYAGGEIRPVRPAAGAVVGIPFDIRVARTVDVRVQTGSGGPELEGAQLQFSSEGGADAWARVKNGVAHVSGLLTGKHKVMTSDGACRGAMDVPEKGDVLTLKMECTQ